MLTTPEDSITSDLRCFEDVTLSGVSLLFECVDSYL